MCLASILLYFVTKNPKKRIVISIYEVLRWYAESFAEQVEDSTGRRPLLTDNVEDVAVIFAVPELSRFRGLPSVELEPARLRGLPSVARKPHRVGVPFDTS